MRRRTCPSSWTATRGSCAARPASRFWLRGLAEELRIEYSAGASLLSEPATAVDGGHLGGRPLGAGVCAGAVLARFEDHVDRAVALQGGFQVEGDFWQRIGGPGHGSARNPAAACTRAAAQRAADRAAPNGFGYPVTLAASTGNRRHAARFCLPAGRLRLPHALDRLFRRLDYLAQTPG